jgi:hypothetical protein
MQYCYVIYNALTGRYLQSAPHCFKAFATLWHARKFIKHNNLRLDVFQVQHVLATPDRIIRQYEIDERIVESADKIY